MTADDLSIIGTLTLPGVPRSVTLTREFIRDMLPEGHPAVEDPELSAAELAANAIRHTDTGKDGWFSVGLWQSSDRLVVEVSDDGAAGARPVLLDPADPAAADPGESGRGLLIVATLSDRWGYREHGGRTTVYAEFAAEADLTTKFL